VLGGCKFSQTGRISGGFYNLERARITAPLESYSVKVVLSIDVMNVRNQVSPPITYAMDFSYVVSGPKNIFVGSMGGTGLPDYDPPLMLVRGNACIGAQLCFVLPITISVRLSPPITLAQIRKASSSSQMPRVFDVLDV
jgi:hypothetical protein